ncbi:MAG: PAS domain S-box protein [Desulfamplus sp.]|nr:PAS domain S-box protein [Desulfamplus sp.]
MKFPYNIATCKKGEERSEDLDSLCNALFEINTAGVMITSLEDGLILDLNDSMLKIIGYSREECIGKSVFDIGFYPSSDIRERFIKSLVEKKQILNKEFSFFTKSETLHYGIYCSKMVELKKRPCIFTSMFDITGKVDAQTSVKNSASKFIKLFQSIPDMLFVVDQSGKILYTNKASQEKLGYTSLNFKSMHILNIYPPDKKYDVINIVGKTLSGRSYKSSIPLLTFNGNNIDVETKAVLTNWDNQDVILIISRDVTERILMRKKQKELETMLRHTHKMEAIGALAGGIAHDFNNILFPITAYSEMLNDALAAKGVSDNSNPNFDDLKDYVKEIYSAAMRAKELVKQILTFSREANHEIQPVQPILIVKEAIKLIRKTLPQSIKVNYYINQDCNMVMTDPTQIYQIIMNLMVNAFHAMELSGGTLTVTLDNRDEEGVKYVYISVSDTGIGMDELTIEKIFNPYFTTKPQGKGTGLGLSVVHGIVNLYKGKISVKSAIGKGSTFDILLPAMEGDEKECLPVETKTITNGCERILLVDDEATIIIPQTKILERLGYKVTSFTSSAEALKAFEKEPEAFDLVITDLSMPNISGTQLSEAILKISPKMPIIMCTGFSYNLTSEKIKEMGISALLTKPIIRAEISRAIREVLDSKDCNQ